MGKYIEIIGAREHNLQNVSVRIPQNKVTVVTGLSGSGKTSLIMDTLKKESMRQFWNCFDDNDKVYEKPNVNVINGLTPVVEHNLDLIISSDYVIDLGIGGGENGGELLYQGEVEGILNASKSFTGQCIHNSIQYNF